MADMATASILGRNTGGTGAPVVLSAATANSLLSLNNVENTALSTWSGSSTITTVGTITSGVWNAGAVTSSGTVTGNLFSGSGASLTNLNATNLSSGTVATARMGTGTADSTTYLRGDNTWAAPASGGADAGTWCGLATSSGGAYTSAFQCSGQSVASTCPSGYTQRTIQTTSNCEYTGYGPACTYEYLRTCSKN
jgi:hypothetical protein